jgi:ABC-type glucose/galactose transport system permease subunit
VELEEEVDLLVVAAVEMVIEVVVVAVVVEQGTDLPREREVVVEMVIV